MTSHDVCSTHNVPGLTDQSETTAAGNRVPPARRSGGGKPYRGSLMTPALQGEQTGAFEVGSLGAAQ
jgi:hypothetical protein